MVRWSIAMHSWLEAQAIVLSCPSEEIVAGPDQAGVTRMLVNEFISWRRKWARFIPYAELPAARYDAQQGSRDHALAHAERDALIGDVRRLPPRQRLVIALRDFGDLDDRHIAHWCTIFMSVILHRLLMRPRCCQVIAQLA